MLIFIFIYLIICSFQDFRSYPVLYDGVSLEILEPVPKSLERAGPKTLATMKVVRLTADVITTCSCFIAVSRNDKLYICTINKVPRVGWELGKEVVLFKNGFNFTRNVKSLSMLESQVSGNIFLLIITDLRVLVLKNGDLIWVNFLSNVPLTSPGGNFLLLSCKRAKSDKTLIVQVRYLSTTKGSTRIETFDLKNSDQLSKAGEETLHLTLPTSACIYQNITIITGKL